jgi:hypothetical protein
MKDGWEEWERTASALLDSYINSERIMNTYLGHKYFSAEK